MRFHKIRLNHFLICVCVISIFLLFCMTVFSGGNKQAGTIAQVHILGSYSIDGQQPKELTQNTVIDSHGLDTVAIRGHFSADVPQGWVLMLRLDNIRARISLNGEEVYRYGAEESIPDFSKTAGATWDYYASPGITTRDDVEIVIQNIYEGRTTNAIDRFMSSIYLGHGYELYDQMLQEKMPSILFGFIIFVAGIILLTICAIGKIFKHPSMERGIALSCITIVGGLWIFFDGGYPYATLLFRNPLFFNTVDVMQLFIVPTVFSLYVFTCLENNKAKKVTEIISSLSLLLLAAVVFIQILGLHDLYEMQNMAVVWSIFVVAFLTLVMIYEGMFLKKRQTLLMFLSWLPFFISAFMEEINYFYRYMPERGAVKYGFALSVLLQFYQMIRIMRNNAKRAQMNMRLENEVLQSRLTALRSQIQPHFLFNTLNDIRFLYRESPEQAEMALISFTKYLRGNMDSLNQKELVPFMQELNHVNNYVDIEKMRFEEKLKVVFKIGCSQFFVPVLTIQPLVENAIRHGVMKKTEGGTVTVRTFENAHDFAIEVLDDGVGYDTSATADDGQSHNGIENVRTRLRIMCGGSLEIRSRLGEGTSVSVRIPKEKQNEILCG